MKKLTIPSLVLILALFMFLMCGPNDDNTTNPTSDAGDSSDSGDSGGAGDGGNSTHTLTISKTGDGSVTPAEGDHTYDHGTSVDLTATADTNWHFVRWDGGVEDVNSAYTSVTVDSDKTVTAVFDVVAEKNEMISITGGTYTQTDTAGHSFSHTISNFSMGKYEVTYDLWHAVYKWATSDDHGYQFANSGTEGKDGTAGADPTDDSKYHPVTIVNWRDCIVWCNAYSEMTGLTPVYKSGDAVLKDSRDDNGTNCDNASCDWSANGYRLPTEGEWQFAASNKGGTPPNYASGATADYNDAGACEEVAWYSANSGYDAHPVGDKTSNDPGLHDMSGNVYEWCWDWKGDYPSGPETDYRGAASGSRRVLRGGSWYVDAFHLRVGYRSGSYPSSGYNSFGFRVVRVP